MILNTKLESILREALAKTKDLSAEDRKRAAWEACMKCMINNNIPNGPALQQMLRDRIAQIINKEQKKKKTEIQFRPYCHGHHPTAALASGWKCPQTRIQYDPRLLSS